MISDILINWYISLTESISTLILVSFSSSFSSLPFSFGNITMEIVVSLLKYCIYAVVIATKYSLFIELSNQVIAMFSAGHEYIMCLIEIVLW